MSHKVIPYQRYWHNSGEVLPLDENGFLRDPTIDWYQVYYQDEEVFKLSELMQFECLLLLGEPGIGKSTELEKLEAKEEERNHKKVAFTLRRFESKIDFKQSVLEDVVVSDWIKGNSEPLSIYLDGLDEALLEAKKISYGVLDVVKELNKYGEVFIRITCRTSDLPKEFQAGLEALYHNRLKAVEVAPLRREDVRLAAKEYGIDEKAFFSAIYEKELGVLASRPITLNMLIKEYLDFGKISESIEGVYEKGCLYLLEDTDDRKEAGFVATLTQSQRLVIAERIAANLILCNYSNLFTGSISELTNVDLNVDKIDSGEEVVYATGEKVKVFKGAIDEVIHTSLFKPLGNDRFVLTHQTFAEYLTARYLLRNQLTMPQLKSILLHDDGHSKGVVPQLKEVAMWLSSMHDKFFHYLIEIDPAILLKSSVWVKDDDKLKALLASLIDKVFERKINLNYLNHFKFLKNLEYEGIEEDLKARLNKPEYDLRAKKLIIDIIDALKIDSLADELVNVALDEKNVPDLRIHALDILTDLKNSTEAKSNLTELLSSPSKDDYLLIASAIKCLYPEIISPEVLVVIFEQNEGIEKTILGNSGHVIIENSEASDLVTLLDWAGDNFPERNFPSSDRADFFDQLIIKAVKYIKNEKVKKSLSWYIIKKIGKHYRLFDATLSERSYKEFLSHSEERRLIVQEIIKIFIEENEDDFAYKLRRYEHSLVIDEDFDWVLDHVLTSDNEKEGILWVKILRWSFRTYESDHVEKILINQENELIKNEFYSLLTPIDITSQEAKDERERHNEIWGKKDEPPQKIISLQELLERDFKELKEGNIEAFYWLDRNLSLDEDSQNYTNDLKLKSEDFYGWVSANKSLKSKIAKYAEDFLIKTSPAKDNWLNDNYSRTAYRALRYIEDFDQEILNKIPNDIWLRWLKPILYFELNDAFKLGQRFTKILNEKFIDEVIEFVCELIRLENEKHNGQIFVTRKLDSILTKGLIYSLFALLQEEELKPRAKEIIIERLLKWGHSGALESIKSNLNKNNEDEFIINAFLLIKYSPDHFFEGVWEEFQKDTELSKKIAQKIAAEDRHQQDILKSLTEEQLAKLYIWLETNYPVNEENFPSSGTVTYRMMLADLRRYTLNQIIYRGTEAACEQMKKIVDDLPDRKWLKLKFEEAKEVYIRENWVPLKVDHLLRLASNEKAWLVKNEHDLLHLTLDKLNELQDRLQNQEQSEAINYWNEKPKLIPKDENRMSDLIKNYLQDVLVNSGVILNREVEIERGSKTDIHVTAIIPNEVDFTTIKLVIEVKGCWHKELKTAFRTQLIEQYLHGKGIKAGIYLIGWFKCDRWDTEDYRNKQSPNLAFEEAEEFFVEQGKELKDEFPSLLIESKTLNISI